MPREFTPGNEFDVTVKVVKQGIDIIVQKEGSEPIVIEFDEEAAISIATAILFRVGVQQVFIKKPKNKDGILHSTITSRYPHPFQDIWDGTNEPNPIAPNTDGTVPA